MKKSRLILIVLFGIAFMMQSCFEIREIIHIKKDGSGTFSMVIDMSEMKSMIESFSEAGDTTASSPLSEMSEEYASTREALSKIEGISNIRLLSENDGYVINTSFDFANPEALNAGMNIVYENKDQGSTAKYYIFRKSTFERTEAHNFLNKMKEELNSNEMQSDDIDLSSIFSDVAYVNTVTFDGMKVKKVKSGNVEISEDGSTVTMKRYIFKKDEDQSTQYKLKVK